jgi:hypothetical protein
LDKNLLVFAYLFLAQALYLLCRRGISTILDFACQATSLTKQNTITGSQQNDHIEMADALNGGESDKHEDNAENDHASDSAKSCSRNR